MTLVASSAGLSSTHISRNRKMEDVGKLTGFPSPSKKPNSFTAIIQMMFLLRCFLFTKNKKKNNLQEHLAHTCRNLSNFSCFAKLLLEPSILVKRVVAINIFFFSPHIESSILPNTSLTQAITVKYSNPDFCFPLWLLAHWAPCLLLDSVTSDIYHCRDRPCQEHFGFRQKTKIDALQK